MTSHLRPGALRTAAVRAIPPTPRGPVPEDLVTHPHDDAAPVEHDPTGMRDLPRRACPTPGRCPTTSSPASPPPCGRGGCRAAPLLRTAGRDVVPLRPAPGSARLRHLGVAAAVVTAFGLGGVGVAAPGGRAPAARPPPAGPTPAAPRQGSGSRRPSGSRPGRRASALRGRPTRGSGEVVVVMSGPTVHLRPPSAQPPGARGPAADPSRPGRRGPAHRPDRAPRSGRGPAPTRSASRRRRPRRRRRGGRRGAGGGDRRAPERGRTAYAVSDRAPPAPRPHRRSGVPGVTRCRAPARATTGGAGPCGNTAGLGSVARRHRILRSPPATTTRGCVL